LGVIFLHIHHPYILHFLEEGQAGTGAVQRARCPVRSTLRSLHGVSLRGDPLF
jgi:hypothetical protein